MNLILASKSPRRKAILNQLDYQFEIIPSIKQEIIPKNIKSEHIPEYLAKEKSQDISRQYPDKYVLGYDTLIFYKDEIIGKPKDKNDAQKILETLSGQVHEVISGIALSKNNKILYSNIEKTKVYFRNLSTIEIKNYISTNEPYDKAGAYGIQAKGARFVKKIEGCYFNVMGLPVSQTIKAYEKYIGV